MDAVVRAPAATGAVALESEAADCFSLSAVQRCNRRIALQLRGVRSARAAQAARHRMWRERALRLEAQLGELLDAVSDIEEDQPLARRVRRLVYLRRQDQEVLVRIMGRRPSLLPWAMRQQAAVRAQLDSELAAESETELEQ